VGAAISSLCSFAIGAFVPLLPWIVTSTGNPVVWSIVLAVLAAAVVGGVIGWFTRNASSSGRFVKSWSAR